MSEEKNQLHPEIIRAYVRMTGKTFEDIAKENNVSSTAIRIAISKPSLIGEQIISKYTGIPLHILWPDRWTPKGQRIRPRYSRKYNKVA